MNINTMATQTAAPAAVLIGLLVCFFGCRIVKLSVGVMGLIAGATGGWAAGLQFAPHNNTVIIACAVAGGLVGAILCIWLFFFGIFLLGASAGVVVAIAVLNATGHQPEPIPVLVAAAASGIVALLLRNFMIIVSTAFSGSYLLTAGLLRLFTGTQHTLWFEQLKGDSALTLGYVALGVWLLFGLVGMRFQFKAGHKKKAPEKTESKGS